MAHLEKREFSRVETVKGIGICLSAAEAADLSNILRIFATHEFCLGNFTQRERAISLANDILRELQK